jgi:hypothetical protein
MPELFNKIVAGELAMSGQEDSARTAYNAEAVAAIRPGSFVAIATALEGNLERRGVILPVGANSIIVGACKRWYLKDEHPPKDQVAYYFRGVIGVLVVAAVKSGDPVFTIFTPGLTQGRATNVAGANAVLVPNARFLSTIGAGEVAICSLNLP